MKRLVTVAITVATMALPGCTFSRLAMIQSEPGGAEIYYKTQLRGTTPAPVKLPCVGLNSDQEPLSGFGDNVVELRKPGFRPMQAVVDGRWQWNNVIFGGLVGILLWGKCPGETYTYKLQSPRADLDGKASFTVWAMPPGMTVSVDGVLVALGTPLVLEGNQPHDVTVLASSSSAVLNRGTLQLEPDTDYATSLLFVKR